MRRDGEQPVAAERLHAPASPAEAAGRPAVLPRADDDVREEVSVRVGQRRADGEVEDTVVEPGPREEVRRLVAPEHGADACLPRHVPLEGRGGSCVITMPATVPATTRKAAVTKRLRKSSAKSGAVSTAGTSRNRVRNQ